MPRYKRVLIKLSGAAVAGKDHFGFDAQAVNGIVRQVLDARNLGMEVCVVIGGGNIFRGTFSTEWGIERAEADHIGMLGTVINSLMLRAALKAHSEHEVRVMTAIPMDAIAERYIRLRADQHLKKGYIVIFAAGIGQPYVTTDYPAVQRALEVGCDAILVAKDGVDGVFSADPKKDPSAKRYISVSYQDFLTKGLNVMDQSALILARDHKIPLHIFNINTAGSVAEICRGKNCGTIIAPDVATVTE
ncbi:MAG: UMP kinase [Bacteriovoracaceae bacterium]|nr:UMP kinase [Bacteriovoracaceae bacterium]